MTAISFFEVTGWDPKSADEPESGPALSRVVISKAFTGDELEGTSIGDGLFCGMGDPSQGAGYVVSERITGRLGQLNGTFVIQHGGLMGPDRAPETFGNIVPGSGTGDLAGVNGTVEISRDAEGKHRLILEYTLPE